jgi:hypothetical protein
VSPRPRLERGTYCLGGTFEAWPHSAGCSLTCRLAPARLAGRGLARPRICGRWLPVRLPGFSLATLTSECSRPDAITNRESRRHATPSALNPDRACSCSSRPLRPGGLVPRDRLGPYCDRAALGWTSGNLTKRERQDTAHVRLRARTGGPATGWTASATATSSGSMRYAA